MRTVAKALLAAALVAGSNVAAIAPAQADRGSTAVVAGLIGLGIGAAIASDHDRTYYSEPVQYYSPPAYYGGYGYGYAPSYSYGYGSYYGHDRNHYRDRRDWRRDDRRHDRDGYRDGRRNRR